MAVSDGELVSEAVIVTVCALSIDLAEVVDLVSLVGQC